MASAVEDQLAEHGLEIDPEVVDQILRNRIDAVAEVMRVTPRTALGYAPDNLPAILADTITQASRALPTTMPCGSRRPDLRLVNRPKHIGGGRPACRPATLVTRCAAVRGAERRHRDGR